MQIEVPRAPSTAAMTSDRATTPVILDTIIPDAYQVTLTINDLHAESQNFLHHVIANKDKVTTYEYETSSPDDALRASGHSHTKSIASPNPEDALRASGHSHTKSIAN